MPISVNQNVIVLDNGTGYLKAGFAGSNEPACNIPTIIGKPILRASESTIDGRSGLKEVKDLYLGDEAAAHRNILDIQNPVENGVVKDWEGLQKLWAYALGNKLGLSDGNFKNHKIMLTEAPLNPVKNRQQMLETVFEGFGFGHAHVALQAVLVLYAQGLQTGVVVDSGDGVIHVIPVFEGHQLSTAIKRLDIAGRDVTRQLVHLLNMRGYSFHTSTSDFEAIKELKERMCYVG